MPCLFCFPKASDFSFMPFAITATRSKIRFCGNRSMLFRSRRHTIAASILTTIRGCVCSATMSTLWKEGSNKNAVAQGWWRSRSQLVVTCGLEHFTTIFAELLLREPELLDKAPKAYRELWLWHALEELEHTSVPYDVMLEVLRPLSPYKRYVYRTTIMFKVTRGMVSLLYTNYLTIVRANGGDTGLIARLRWTRKLIFSPGYLRKSLLPYLRYFHPHFHPNRYVDPALVRQWQQRIDSDQSTQSRLAEPKNSAESLSRRFFRTFVYAAAQGRISSGIQKVMWKWWYQRFNRGFTNTSWMFLNYGYLPSADDEAVPLDACDEKDRCFIGLYHQALVGIEVRNKRLLEVGAGRGGGCSYIARYMEPAEVVGIDYAEAAVQLATQVHASVPNLTFRQGDAEDLPLSDQTFDVVVNVESSHCYPNMGRFVENVVRVLRPGGFFAWADMRAPAFLDATEQAFAGRNLTLVRDVDISANVLAALDAMNEVKTAQIQQYPWFRALLREFNGVKGSLLYKGLRSGEVVYMSRVYQKTTGDPQGGDHIAGS